jgi:hypothetical protein
MIDLRIEQWRAWAPGLEDEAAWRAWARHPALPDAADTQPSCDFLPAMQRRRLSRLARMTLDVAWPLCAEGEQLPFVFASRHGETPRTFALLSDVAAEQPLSPTQFGLSVHNAIAGQWSMLRGQRGESVAIAGEADTFEHAMVEAAGLLNDATPSVLVVIAEERPPAAYDTWIDDVPFSYAVALRVGRIVPGERTEGTDWRLELTTGDNRRDTGAWPHALDFLRSQLAERVPLEHPWKRRRWIWQPLR